MRLITIVFSHYSEKARWALDFMGVPYTEDGRLPMQHLLATVPLGGRSVPVLQDGGALLLDSTDILLHLDARQRGRLFPDDPAERAAALEIEDFCDRRVGVASRAWVYSETLTSPVRLGRRLGASRPPLQRALLPLLMTVSGPLIARSYGVKPGHPEKWLDKLRASFDEASRLLDGKRYFVGDRFTAADLSFAALAAPALLPPGHPRMQSDLSVFRPEARQVVEELRDTPAGLHALRMYREHR